MNQEEINIYLAGKVKLYLNEGILLSEEEISYLHNTLDVNQVNDEAFRGLYDRSILKHNEERQNKQIQEQQLRGKIDEVEKEKRRADELYTIAQNRYERTEQQLAEEKEKIIEMQKARMAAQRSFQIGQIALIAVWLGVGITLVPGMMYAVSIAAGAPEPKWMEIYKDLSIFTIGALFGIVSGYVGAKSYESGKTKMEF